MNVSKTLYKEVRGTQPANLTNFNEKIFKQFDGRKFNLLLDAVGEKACTDGDIYQQLLARKDEAQGGIFSKIARILTGLREEKETLAAMVGQVMDPNRSLSGYVEIGFPGRMVKSLLPLMGVKGHIAAVVEKEQKSDLIQCGFPRPYQEFKTLDYQPLALPKESCDVVSCFIGLHHCPEEKLEAFISSIKQVLRPGGLFLLREHDAATQDVKDLAWVIHSVFNAGTGVSYGEEKAEVRNFQSLAFWCDLLEKAGLRLVSEPLLRAEDPTENKVVKFVKVSEGERGQFDYIKERLITALQNSKRDSKDPPYIRPLVQTYLTGTEWLNVESSQNISNAPNFWDYRYFRDIGQLWSGLVKSWKNARKVESFTGVLTSPHIVMNSFITTMMTIEYFMKGFFFFPLWVGAQVNRLLPQAPIDEEWQKPADFYKLWLKQYGENLEHTTFYAQNYLPGIQQYWKGLAESWKVARKQRSFLDLTFDRQTVKNLITGLAMTIDLTARIFASTPLYWLFNGPDGDARRIGMIVKTNETIENGDCKVFVKEDSNPYQGLVVPRYKKLEAVLKDFAQRNIQVVEIAGQTKIQLDVRLAKDTKEPFKGILHERAYLPDSSQKIVALQVEVKELHIFLTKHGDKVHRIYDY